MRQVKRPANSAPSSLDSLDSKGKSERDRARDHQNDPDPKKGSFTYAAYKHEQVKRRLAQLFHNKCAYCETFFCASAPVDIEHYRPKAAVSEDPDHTGYWWLAMSWDNLLPSCIDCNRRRKQRVADASTSLEELHKASRGEHSSLALADAGKKDSFPLIDAKRRLVAESYACDDEQPYLLDPTRDDPREHLHFHIDRDSPIGIVLPGSAPGHPSQRGAMSIQIYGLNRLGLVQDRTRLLRHLEFLGDLSIELGDLVEDLTDPGLAPVRKRLELLQERIHQEIRDMTAPEAPYSEMVRTWLKQFLDGL
ncbi:MAG: HNH endonuclease [Pseudomonas putida]|jgi:hypothetical protein|nr:HNH endonuclease [Pseudomonas putida]